MRSVNIRFQRGTIKGSIFNLMMLYTYVVLREETPDDRLRNAARARENGIHTGYRHTNGKQSEDEEGEAREDSTTHTFEAGVVCFSFDPGKRHHKTLAQVHRPVPGYEVSLCLSLVRMVRGKSTTARRVFISKSFIQSFNALHLTEQMCATEAMVLKFYLPKNTHNMCRVYIHRMYY